MGERVVNLAVVGSGNWARLRHFPALDRLRREPAGDYRLALRGICSLDLEGARQVAAEYGLERVYADLDELLADDEVTALSVLVRPWSLQEVLVRLVPRGLPLLSEKTPGLTVDEAVEMAEGVTVPNVMATNRRYAPLNNRFREVVGQMQGLYLAAARFYRHDRRDEPFAVETGIHIVDFLDYVFGPVATARTEVIAHPDNGTFARVTRLRFASGLSGVLEILPCSGMLVERVEAHSADLSAILHGSLNDDRGRLTLYRGGGHGGTGEVIEGSDDWAVEQGFVGEYDELCRLVLDGAAPRSTFQSIVRSMRVAEAIQLGVDLG